MGIRRKDFKTRTTPKTFGELRFEDWLWLLDADSEDYGEEGQIAGIKARKRAEGEVRYQKNTKGPKPKIGGSECQEEDLSPAVKKRLNGYIRTNFYADTPSGKSLAKQQADTYRRNYEGELFVNVRRVYCKDNREWGWSVWVKPTGTKMRKRNYWATEDGKLIRKTGEVEQVVIAPRRVKAGGFASADSREWGQWRGAAKKKVSCPTCFAPTNYPCVNNVGIEEGIYLNEKGKPMSASQASQYREGRGMSLKVRSKRTNAHRERVTKYLEKKEGFVEVPQSVAGRTGDFVQDTERRPPTDEEKESYLLRIFNESQLERFEELEDRAEGYGLSDIEAIMNKKQVVKYDKWKEYGVEVKTDGEV